ncbi:MAG: hypothetical protein WD825_16740 [Gemmatimonadaceae bacterium]
MSEIRRYVPVLIGGMALIAAGCRDMVAPASGPTALVRLGDRSYSALVSDNEGADAVEVLFDIPAAGGSVRVGEFTVTFDANSVCDPSTSGYGPELWLSDCQTLDTDFPIRARFFTADGKSHVEFLPDIRFHPERNVTVTVVRPEVIAVDSTQALDAFEVWYTVRIEDTRYFIDEAWYDPSLVTQVNTETGQVRRRVRHFSGIVIHVGYCTDFPDDPACTTPTIE